MTSLSRYPSYKMTSQVKIGTAATFVESSSKECRACQRTDWFTRTLNRSDAPSAIKVFSESQIWKNTIWCTVGTSHTSVNSAVNCSANHRICWLIWDVTLVWSHSPAGSVDELSIGKSMWEDILWDIKNNKYKIKKGVWGLFFNKEDIVNLFR